MNEQRTVEMTHTKSTKGTHVYSAQDEDAVCTQVYLQRDKLPDPPPKSITLTVAFTKGN